MIIRPYGELPRTYAPDVGEVVEARRTPADKFIKAVVVNVTRNREGALRVRVQWLEDNPDAGAPDKRQRKPIKALSHGWIVVVNDMPPLLRQTSGGAAFGSV